jgi:cytochrome b subunit of formate dehydrogenase
MWSWIKLLGATLMYIAACTLAVLIALTGYWGADHYQVEPLGMRNVVKALAIFVFVDHITDAVKSVYHLLWEYRMEKRIREEAAEKAEKAKEEHSTP